MIIYKLITLMEIDESNINAPTLEQCRDAVEDSLSTPDNDHYGIKKIHTVGEIASKENKND